MNIYCFLNTGYIFFYLNTQRRMEILLISIEFMPAFKLSSIRLQFFFLLKLIIKIYQN